MVVEMGIKDQIKPITYLKNNTADLVRQVSESGHSVIITQNGEARAVVMGVETYDRWRRSLALLRMIAHGEAEIDAGATMTQEEAFLLAEAAIDRASGDA